MTGRCDEPTESVHRFFAVLNECPARPKRSQEDDVLVHLILFFVVMAPIAYLALHGLEDVGAVARCENGILVEVEK